MGFQKIIICAFFLVVSTWVSAQKPPETQSEFDKEYQRRITKDVLYGVYIPKDLADAFIELNKKIDPESKADFKNYPEEKVADKLFYSFGRWMIHNWGFYGGSRLSHYIKGLGIYHPEDMSRFVIVAYHRYLNKKPLDVKELMKIFHEKQDKEKEEFLKKGEVLHQETRQRPAGGGE